MYIAIGIIALGLSHRLERYPRAADLLFGVALALVALHLIQGFPTQYLEQRLARV